MADADIKRLWEGACVLKEVHLIERDDGRSQMVFVWKKRFGKFLRRAAARPLARPFDEGGRHD